jgi:CheY-like chemotaxis protein
MDGIKTVYIADDDEDDRMLIREAIEHVISGVRVIELQDGSSLLNALRQSKPSNPFTIVMDMNMPRMNGLETLREIRAMYSIAEAPVVMMSTTLNDELTLRAYDEAINGFIPKPITEEEFVHMARVIDLCFLQRDANPRRWTQRAADNAQDVVFIHENATFEQTLRSHLRKIMPFGNITELFCLDEARCFFDSKPFTRPDRPNLIIFQPVHQSGVKSPYPHELKKMLVHHKLTSCAVIVCNQFAKKQHKIKESVYRPIRKTVIH